MKKKTLIPLVLSTLFLFVTNDAFVQTLLVDFGASSGQNVYNTATFPGWNAISFSPNISYTSASGHTGLTMPTAPADAFGSYVRISGNTRSFTYGERITVTWYNNSGGDIVFNPLISFTDQDYPVDAPGEPNWFIFGELTDFTIFPGDTIQTTYDISNSASCGPMIPESQGNWSTVNICMNTTQTGLILDKIMIGPADTSAPGIPSNLQVTGTTTNSIELSWNAVSDNTGGDGFYHYEIWESGLCFGSSDTNSFTAYQLESNRQYYFQILAVDNNRNKSILSSTVQASTLDFIPGGGIINPYTDLQYMGAFLIPSGGTGSDFGYMDGDLAYYPDGDPGNTDAYSGSLFIPGNATLRYVCEISIPEPVISVSHDISDLNHAAFLQDFYDIKSPNVPIVPFSWSKGPALEYLPAQAGQTQAYLYTCFGDFYMWNGERLKSFGACNTGFSNLTTYGGWYMGSETPYTEPYYMSTITFNFDMPVPINGHLLVAGGSRWGDVHHGPTLLAYSPWNDGSPLPADNAHLSYTPLLMYDTDAGTHRLNGHEYCDIWNGGAWLSAGSEEAIAVAGNKARGISWYGYNNGESTFNVMFNLPTPIEPEDHGPRQSHENPMLLFYHPADLQNVANGTMETYEPQPYAVLEIQDELFYPNHDDPAYGMKYRGPGGLAFDRQNGLLYLMEQNATGYDTTEAIIHVWKIIPEAGINENITGNINIFSYGNVIHVNLNAYYEAGIDIINLMGQTIYTETTEGKAERLINTQLPAGIYLVRVTAKNKTFSKKIILE